MLIFLFGEDNYRSGEKLNQIKKKFLASDRSGSGLSVVDYGEKNQDFDIKLAAESGGLFSVKKLIIIKNILLEGRKDEQEKVLKYLDGNEKLLADNDTVVVFFESGTPDRRGKFFKFLFQKTKKQEFSFLSGAQLSNWIVEKVKEENAQVSLSEKALEKLMVFCGNDLFRLENEIKKLTSYRSKGVIEEEDVDLLVTSKISSNIFETVEALSLKNKKKALQLFHEQLEKGEDPFYVFSMYVYQFRNLLKLSDFSEEKGVSNQQIAKVVGLHPFVVQKTRGQLKNFNQQELLDIYQKLEKLDQEVKTGKTDMILGIEKMIVEI